jgi:CheY-like chemotaxis protein
MATTSSERTRQWRVLLVEDDRETREIIGEWLGEAGFEVVQAENGAVAIEAAVVRHPDVIVTDLQMPVMDGFEEIARLQGDERTREIPVVVLSGTLPDQATMRRMRGGAFLTKPCDLRDLDGVLHNLVDAARAKGS